MSAWDVYPDNYREREINQLLAFTKAGESAAVIGLSGSGKSNLFGFMAQRAAGIYPEIKFVLIDCNRLMAASKEAFLLMARQTIAPEQDDSYANSKDVLAALDRSLAALLNEHAGVCLMLDRFDALYPVEDFSGLTGNLRALRDRYKYQLTYIVGARRPLDAQTELSELFFGRTLWLGPLSTSDARWSCKRDGQRLAGLGKTVWDDRAMEKLVELSWGYPALLRAVCEAYANGAQLELSDMLDQPAVTRRVAEFWADEPTAKMIRLSGLTGQPLLQASLPAGALKSVDLAELTAKEHQLLEYLRNHRDQVCTKDELIQAVWPEDVIFEQGVRDESLAQLVRRLRVKVEQNPTEPRFIQTVAGRGYIFRS